MEFSSVTEAAFFSASTLSFVLSIAFIYQALKNNVLWIMAAAALVQTLWLLGITFRHWLPEGLGVLLLSESAHYVMWLLAVNKTTEKYFTTKLPWAFKACVYLICFLGLGVAGYNCLFSSLNIYEQDILIWQGIVFSIITLLSIEQLYRNNTQLRFFKLLCLGLAIVYIFDAYLFTQHLVFSRLDSELWQARASVSMAASLLMVLGIATITQPTPQSAKLTFSRPVVFYTTSLTLIGALLTILSIGGYYVWQPEAYFSSVLYSRRLI